MTTLEFLRQFRLGEYAIFDLTVSFLGIYLLSPLLSKIFLKIGLNIPKQNWLFLTLPIGILFHLFFGRMTPMTVNLLDLHSNYLLKLLFLILIWLGLRGIKLISKK
jgi:hypothetical protein